MRLRTVIASTLLFACSEPPTPHSRPKESPSAEVAKPEAPPKPTPSPKVTPSSEPKGPGPLPESDQEVGRRAAVYALLAGGSMATNLPEKASDGGKSFDPNLAEAMATSPGTSTEAEHTAPK